MGERSLGSVDCKCEQVGLVVDAIDRRIDEQLVRDQHVELREVALQERLVGPVLEPHDTCPQSGSSAYNDAMASPRGLKCPTDGTGRLQDWCPAPICAML